VSTISFSLEKKGRVDRGERICAPNITCRVIPTI
jgi:hypothetical protein